MPLFRDEDSEKQWNEINLFDERRRFALYSLMKTCDGRKEHYSGLKASTSIFIKHQSIKVINVCMPLTTACFRKIPMAIETHLLQDILSIKGYTKGARTLLLSEAKKWKREKITALRCASERDHQSRYMLPIAVPQWKLGKVPMFSLLVVYGRSKESFLQLKYSSCHFCFPFEM